MTITICMTCKENMCCCMPKNGTLRRTFLLMQFCKFTEKSSKPAGSMTAGPFYALFSENVRAVLYHRLLFLLFILEDYHL